MANANAGSHCYSSLPGICGETVTYIVCLFNAVLDLWFHICGYIFARKLKYVDIGMYL